tara:strand:+ start:247 stop:1113 length:867 start_codon:yes stop_codon:yes gene_type:complete
MTFNPVTASNIIESLNFFDTSDLEALDIGAQTPTLNIEFIDFLINKYDFLDKDQVKKLNLLKNTLSQNKKFYTKDFFLALNFRNYNSIDINGAYKSEKFDLNKNIYLEYNFKKKYNLVINNGTGEHIFNQYSLFLNIHNLTKKEGLMIHVLPFIDWINHGFFNYNPLLFADLAASNKYEIVKMSLANRDAAEINLEKKNYSAFLEQIKPNNIDSPFKKIINFAIEKLGKNILIVVIMKKKDNNNFTIPLQGKYLGDIIKTDLHKDYSKQKEGSQKAKNQISDNNKRKN